MACEEAELGPEAFARKMEEVKKFQQQVCTENCQIGLPEESEALFVPLSRSVKFYMVIKSARRP